MDKAKKWVVCTECKGRGRWTVGTEVIECDFCEGEGGYHEDAQDQNS